MMSSTVPMVLLSNCCLTKSFSWPTRYFIWWFFYPNPTHLLKYTQIAFLTFGGEYEKFQVQITFSSKFSIHFHSVSNYYRYPKKLHCLEQNCLFIVFWVLDLYLYSNFFVFWLQPSGSIPRILFQPIKPLVLSRFCSTINTLNLYHKLIFLKPPASCGNFCG